MSRPSELAGLKVAHDFDEFVEGREVVLTLQDQYILNNGTELNEELDTLHNIELTENFKVEFYNKIKDNIKRGDYDEDKYENLEKKPILSKYDEQKPEKKGILLDSHGTFDLEKKNKLELIKNRLTASAKNQKFVDLNVEKVIASDYKPKEETKGFKKPKAVKKDKKKMKDLLDFLEENAEETMEDYGNRDKLESKKRREEMEALAEKKQKVEIYEGALNRAKEQNQESLKRNMEDEQVKEEFAVDLDEFDELERALERQRRMLQNKKRPVEDAVKDLMASNILLENQKFQINKELNIQDFNQMIKEERDAKEGDKQSIRTIITATEFLKNVKTEKELNENQMKITAPTPLNLQNSRNGTASVVNISLPTEKLIGYNKNGMSSVMGGYKSILNKNAKKDSDAEETEKKPDESKGSDSEYSDFEKAHEEIKFLEEEPVGNGLAGTLKNLRERGYLMDMDYSGRTNDALLPEDKNKDEKTSGDRIKLEYRDASGKLMTPKEAYRYMCWIFHGKKPGKKKMEKRLKKEKLEQKIKGKPLQDMPLMKALAKSQEKSTQPHLVLTKKD